MPFGCSFLASCQQNVTTPAKARNKTEQRQYAATTAKRQVPVIIAIISDECKASHSKQTARLKPNRGAATQRRFTAKSLFSLKQIMATSATTTQRRKGGGGAPKSLEGIVQITENTIGLTSTNINSITGGGNSSSLAVNHGGTSTRASSSASPPPPPVAVATVRRNKCGTSPFDENWLNLDCCGLFCAFITYCLHMYGVYAVCMVLLPPWMSTTDDVTGIRSLTFMGHFHRLGFTLVAVMASYAHFKAMTTDPGAVPPDAMPLSEQQKNNNQIIENGENNGDVTKPSRKGKKLCRRCNAYKPKRAHHCSVCGRCIIKMDRKSSLLFLLAVVSLS